jgi:cob(I)alamin adenosyltransferase
MKIYTKKGDEGITALFGGTKVPKHHPRIEAYGTIDELNAYIGMIRDQRINDGEKSALLKIQNFLFVIGACLAADPNKPAVKAPNLNPEEVTFLENQIDDVSVNLPALKSFILPGGSTMASHCQIARTICRRAERKTCLLAETWDLNPVILQYLNRLSDYLFVLARKFSSDFGGKEIPWNPEK